MVKGKHTLDAWLGMYRHGVVPSHNKSVKVHLFMDGFHFTGFIRHALHTFRHIYLLAAVKGHTKSDIEPATSTNGIILLDKRVWWVVAGTVPTAPVICCNM